MSKRKNMVDATVKRSKNEKWNVAADGVVLEPSGVAAEGCVTLLTCCMMKVIRCMLIVGIHRLVVSLVSLQRVLNLNLRRKYSGYH